ncbi:MAG: hypothetical protein K0R98_1950 [Rickettsiaceae bacterium]|jgi:hypothetical protein|nr:hypothetical protein [Rickettsiaceae bacterium]
MVSVIDLGKFKHDLDAVKTETASDVIEAATKMNDILKAALATIYIQPHDKRQLIEEYAKKWHNKLASEWSEVDFMQINLVKADLAGLNLVKVNLGSADLTMANLKRANLSRSYLGGAKMFGVYLTGAILTGADLGFNAGMMADLTCARLKDAITIGTYGLTEEQKAETINTTDELLDVINYLLKRPLDRITPDEIDLLPNLFIAASDIGSNGYLDRNTRTNIQAIPELAKAAIKLKERFPYLHNPAEIARPIFSSGDLCDKERTNFLALTTLAQALRQSKRGEGVQNSITDIPVEIITRHMVEPILAGRGVVGEDAHNLADAIINGRKGITPQESAEVYASDKEKAVLWKHRFNAQHEDVKASIEETPGSGSFAMRIKSADDSLLKTEEQAKFL